MVLGFSDRQILANETDPDQFAIPSASFGGIAGADLEQDYYNHQRDPTEWSYNYTRVLKTEPFIALSPVILQKGGAVFTFSASWKF